MSRTNLINKILFHNALRNGSTDFYEILNACSVSLRIGYHLLFTPLGDQGYRPLNFFLFVCYADRDRLDKKERGLLQKLLTASLY